jgi:hypothetical protein
MTAKAETGQPVPVDVLWNGIAPFNQESLAAVGIGKDQFVPGQGTLRSYVTPEHVGTLAVIESVRGQSHYGRYVVSIQQEPDGTCLPLYLCMPSGKPGQNSYFFDTITEKPESWRVLAHTEEAVDVQELQRVRLQDEHLSNLTSRLQNSVEGKALLANYDPENAPLGVPPPSLSELTTPEYEGRVLFVAFGRGGMGSLQLAVVENGDIWLLEPEAWLHGYPGDDTVDIDQIRITQRSRTKGKAPWNRSHIIVGMVEQPVVENATQRVQDAVFLYNWDQYTRYYSQKDSKLAKAIATRAIDWEHPMTRAEAEDLDQQMMTAMNRQNSLFAEYVGRTDVTDAEKEAFVQATVEADEARKKLESPKLALRVHSTGVVCAHRIDRSTPSNFRAPGGPSWAGMDSYPIYYFPVDEKLMGEVLDEEVTDED